MFSRQESKDIIDERIIKLGLIREFLLGVHNINSYSYELIEYVKNPKDSWWQPTEDGKDSNKKIVMQKKAADVGIDFFEDNGCYINPPVKECLIKSREVWIEFKKAYQSWWIFKGDNELFLKAEREISERIEEMKQEILESISTIESWKQREIEFLEIINAPFYKLKLKKETKLGLELHIQILKRIRLMFEYLRSKEYNLLTTDYMFRIENSEYIIKCYETLGDSTTYLFPIYSYLFSNIGDYLEAFTSLSPINEDFLESNAKDIVKKIEAIDYNVAKSYLDLELL